MLPRRLSNGVGYTNVGALQHQVYILQRNTRRDANGDFLPPVVFATCWARVQALTDKYTEKAQQVVTEATHRVTVRYIPGLDTSMQVQFNGRIFNIAAILDPDERQVELWLMCYERNSGKG